MLSNKKLKLNQVFRRVEGEIEEWEKIIEKV
jgi:hypothetical protein